jgi:hypothetical protein
MELEAWLAVYQSVNETRAAKERTLWTIVGLFLLGSSLLSVPACLLAASFPDAPSQALVTGLAILGGIVALAWLACQSLAARETRHWECLLRSLEQQFAGGEFHRSAYRLLRGEETCIPTADWRCGDWYPAVARLGWASRIVPQAAAWALPLIFLAAWVILIVATWTT